MAQAKAAHRAGQMAAAAESYRQVLAASPAHAEAHYLLGVALDLLGRPAEAISSLSEAVRLQPAYGEAHHYLGFVLEKSARLDDAVASYEQAWRLKPRSDEIATSLRRASAAQNNNRGNALTAAGRLDEAEACYRQALELKPDHAEAWYNLANAVFKRRRLGEASACYRRAIEYKPDFASAYNNLSIALSDEHKLDEAVACSRRAIELDPQLAEAHCNLGRVLRLQRQLDEAAASCQTAIGLNPNLAEAYNTLTLVLRDQNQLEEAEAACRRALDLKPDYARAQNNLALVMRDRNRLDEAVAAFDRALELTPDFAEAHLNRGLTLLLMGRFAEGWSEYEWRWQMPMLGRPSHASPSWDGSPLAGRTLLVFAEQGLGDTLQFIRYVPLLRQGGPVIVEVQPALVPLLSQSGFQNLVPQGASLPHFDLQVPLLSLPGLLKTDLASIPAEIPYLSADGKLREHWRGKLRATPGFRVGIVWQGSRDSPQPSRAIQLAAFEPLAKLPGVQLVSLQKGFGSEQIAALGDRFSLLDFAGEIDEASGPFTDTAALMCELDLIVSADTATVHLAGGLGVPVWVPLPFAPDWRYLLERTDSPWYPTMRLFRQSVPGDWHAVFENMRGELAKLPKGTAPR
jgi:tetratricopeptide (TPR) repeat protein